MGTCQGRWSPAIRAFAQLLQALTSVPSAIGAQVASKSSINTLLHPSVPASLLHGWVSAATCVDLSAVELTAAQLEALCCRVHHSPHVEELHLNTTDTAALFSLGALLNAFTGLKLLRIRGPKAWIAICLASSDFWHSLQSLLAALPDGLQHLTLSSGESEVEDAVNLERASMLVASLERLECLLSLGLATTAVPGSPGVSKPQWMTDRGVAIGIQWDS
jgi:hypothetical protein